MRANSVLLVALLTLASFGAGLFIGGRFASTKSSRTATAATTPAATQADRLPAIKARPKTTASGLSADVSGPASLAEIEAAIQKAIRKGDNRGYKTLNELILKVNPSDIPQLLSFVVKPQPVNCKSQFRPGLLGR